MRKSVSTMRSTRKDSEPGELGSDFFANAIRVSPETLFSALGAGVTKQQITLRVDKDVIAFFKQQGKGYHRLMNFALRAYMLRQHEALKVDTRRARKSGKKSA